MSDKRGLTRAAGTISAVTFLSRVLGFARDMVIARAFGAGSSADSFFVAFRISNLLRELLAEGSMSAAFIPVFTEYLHVKSREEARELASAVFTLLVFILSGFVLLGIAFSPAIVTAIAPGFTADPGKFSMTVLLTRILFPFMLFIGLAAVTMGVLNSMGSFAAPAFAPVMLNVSMIGFALAVSPRLDNPITGLALGVVFGGLLQLLIQVPPMVKKGMGLRFVFKPAHEGVKKVGRLVVPVIGSQAVTQINIFVSSILASFLPVGSISYLFYAQHLYQFPHGVFGIAIATAILPAMSLQAAKKDLSSLRETLSFGIRFIMFINLPAMVGLIALRVPITSLLFQRGEFSHAATAGTAYALMFYSLGLWAYSGVRIVNAAFYSLHDTRTPVIGAAVTVALNIAFSLLLMGPLSHGGLALATALASSLNMLMLLYIFRKRVGRFGGRAIFKSFVKVASAAAVMGVACHYIAAQSDVWALSGHTAEKGALVAAAIGAGVVVYAAGLYMLKSEELSFFIDTFKLKLKGAGR